MEAPPIAPSSLNNTLQYITNTWSVLTRTHKNLLSAVQDEKAQHKPGNPWPLYISKKGKNLYVPTTNTTLENKEKIENDLRETLGDSYSQIEVVQLSEHDELKSSHFSNEHGLLYLPEPYVVPGGRFNEVTIFPTNSTISPHYWKHSFLSPPTFIPLTHFRCTDGTHISSTSGTNKFTLKILIFQLITL
jgi:nitrate reductase cytochrome c-type subunit